MVGRVFLSFAAGRLFVEEGASLGISSPSQLNLTASSGTSGPLKNWSGIFSSRLCFLVA